MSKIIPYLNFSGKSAEALAYYQSCLGGKLEMMRLGDSPDADKMPPDQANKIMHGSLSTDSFSLYASDMMETDEMGDRPNVLITFVGSAEEVHDVWEKLSVGATIRQELQEVFFGLFGELKDKFGIIWMFQADPPQNGDK